MELRAGTLGVALERAVPIVLGPGDICTGSRDIHPYSGREYRAVMVWYGMVGTDRSGGVGLGEIAEEMRWGEDGVRLIDDYPSSIHAGSEEQDRLCTLFFSHTDEDTDLRSLRSPCPPMPCYRHPPRTL